ncbi:MAG: hypothetical protein KatS3mg111_0606 [Pirellulaceae bacterium]|nr:MAG: hypothetical protein KatS3mg111_0606 [Pirellulaceae bacterium]
MLAVGHAVSNPRRWSIDVVIRGRTKGGAGADYVFGFSTSFASFEVFWFFDGHSRWSARAVIPDVIGEQNMELQDQSTAEVHPSRPAKSRLFAFARAMAVGLAVSGIILGTLPLWIAMPVPIAARCEILGGAMIVLAGALLLLAMFLARGQMRGPSTYNWIAAGLFLVLGSILFAKGYGTESANTRRFNEVKSNLNQLKQALENYETGTTEDPPKAP